MEIHRAKGGLNSLRELAKEIGIIVVGVLIALAAEQVVETAHWAHRVSDAEAAMRAELMQGERDGYYRMAARPCLEAQLDIIQRALVASRETGAAVPLLKEYRSPLRPWQTDAWDSARALQITGHMSTARLTAWSQAYFFITAVHGTQNDELHAGEDLNTLSLNAGKLEPAERDRLFLALVRTRHALRLMNVGPTFLLQRAAMLGLKLSPAEMDQELASARADYGACAVAPDVSKVFRVNGE
jgi:hypothetical protein